MDILQYAKEYFEIANFNLIKRKYQVPALYFFFNKKTRKFYVGSSLNLRQRFNKHLEGYKGQTKVFCKLLLNSMKKHGLENFGFGILELPSPSCSREFLLEREQYWLDFTKAYDTKIGYNICPVAGGPVGVKRSKEFCAKNKLLNTQLLTNATLTKEDIEDIFKLSLAGATRKEIAKKYNVHYNTIGTVLRRTCWWHIHIDEELVKQYKQLHVPNWTSEKDAWKVGEYLSQFEQLTEGFEELGKKFNLCRKAIANINRGKLYPQIKRKFNPNSEYISIPKRKSPSN